MTSSKEKHLLDAMHHLVLYAGGTVSSQVNKLKKVVYQGRTAKKHKPSQYKKTGTFINSRSPATDYGRTKTMMVG